MLWYNYFIINIFNFIKMNISQIDLSVEYIMMCENASEVQEMITTTNQKDFIASADGIKSFVLFSQHQLQSMLFPSHNEDDSQNRDNSVLKSMTRSISEFIDINTWVFTYEQAWLCLVMKLMFKKQWNVITKTWEII